jgi:hypothetical protein
MLQRLTATCIALSFEKITSRRPVGMQSTTRRLRSWSLCAVPIDGRVCWLAPWARLADRWRARAGDPSVCSSRLLAFRPGWLVGPCAGRRVCSDLAPGSQGQGWRPARSGLLVDAEPGSSAAALAGPDSWHGLPKTKRSFFCAFWRIWPGWSFATLSPTRMAGMTERAQPRAVEEFVDGLRFRIMVDIGRRFELSTFPFPAVRTERFIGQDAVSQAEPSDGRIESTQVDVRALLIAPGRACRTALLWRYDAVPAGRSTGAWSGGCERHPVNSGPFG